MDNNQTPISKVPRKRNLADLLRRTERYEQWRRAVFIRDRFACQQCGKRNGRKPIIEAHHLTEFSELVKESGVQSVEQGIEAPLLWDVDNGQTLCHDCHKLTDSFPKGLATARAKKNMTGWYKRIPKNEEQNDANN